MIYSSNRRKNQASKCNRLTSLELCKSHQLNILVSLRNIPHPFVPVMLLSASLSIVMSWGNILHSSLGIVNHQTFSPSGIFLRWLDSGLWSSKFIVETHPFTVPQWWACTSSCIKLHKKFHTKLHLLVLSLLLYSAVWKERNEENNFNQKSDSELIKEQKRIEVETEIRSQVDELMRQELKNLKLVNFLQTIWLTGVAFFPLFTYFMIFQITTELKNL